MVESDYWEDVFHEEPAVTEEQKPAHPKRP
jgi:hypothetical protein